MDYPTNLQPIVAQDICPIESFTITFSQQKEHTDVSSCVSGTDIRVRIFATFRCDDGKIVDEFEQQFPVLEQEMIRGDGGFTAPGGGWAKRATGEMVPTKAWTDFFRDACPDERAWTRAPVHPAPRLRDLFARALLRPTHVELYPDGTGKRLLWLHCAIAAQTTAATEKVAT